MRPLTMQKQRRRSSMNKSRSNKRKRRSSSARQALPVPPVTATKAHFEPDSNSCAPLSSTEKDLADPVAVALLGMGFTEDQIRSAAQAIGGFDVATADDMITKIIAEGQRAGDDGSCGAVEQGGSTVEQLGDGAEQEGAETFTEATAKPTDDAEHKHDELARKTRGKPTSLVNTVAASRKEKRRIHREWNKHERERQAEEKQARIALATGQREPVGLERPNPNSTAAAGAHRTVPKREEKRHINREWNMREQARRAEEKQTRFARATESSNQAEAEISKPLLLEAPAVHAPNVPKGPCKASPGGLPGGIGDRVGLREKSQRQQQPEQQPAPSKDDKSLFLLTSFASSEATAPGRDDKPELSSSSSRDDKSFTSPGSFRGDNHTRQPMHQPPITILRKDSGTSGQDSFNYAHTTLTASPMNNQQHAVDQTPSHESMEQNIWRRLSNSNFFVESRTSVPSVTGSGAGTPLTQTRPAQEMSGGIGRPILPPPGFTPNNAKEEPAPFTHTAHLTAAPLVMENDTGASLFLTRPVQEMSEGVGHSVPPPPGFPPGSVQEEPAHFAVPAPSMTPCVEANPMGTLQATAKEFVPKFFKPNAISPALVEPKDALEPHHFLIESMSSLFSASTSRSESSDGAVPTALVSVPSDEDDWTLPSASSSIQGGAAGDSIASKKGGVADSSSVGGEGKGPRPIFEHAPDGKGVVEDIASGGLVPSMLDFDVGAWGDATKSCRRNSSPGAMGLNFTFFSSGRGDDGEDIEGGSGQGYGAKWVTCAGRRGSIW